MFVGVARGWGGVAIMFRFSGSPWPSVCFIGGGIWNEGDETQFLIECRLLCIQDCPILASALVHCLQYTACKS